MTLLNPDKPDENAALSRLSRSHPPQFMSRSEEFPNGMQTQDNVNHAYQSSDSGVGGAHRYYSAPPVSQSGPLLPQAFHDSSHRPVTIPAGIPQSSRQNSDGRSFDPYSVSGIYPGSRCFPLTPDPMHETVEVADRLASRREQHFTVALGVPRSTAASNGYLYDTEYRSSPQQHSHSIAAAKGQPSYDASQYHSEPLRGPQHSQRPPRTAEQRHRTKPVWRP